MAAPCLAAGRRPSALARRCAPSRAWPSAASVPSAPVSRLRPDFVARASCLERREARARCVLSGGEPACFASGEQKLAGDPRPRGFFRAIECLPWPHSLLSLFDARRELEASGVGGGGLTSRVRSLIWSLRGPLIQYPACLRTGAATPA